MTSPNVKVNLNDINKSSVVTRFAPSPTGFLHIGSMRTALFNYLFTKNANGKFLLRIEDTDQKRSLNPEDLSLIEDLKWLGLLWDEEIVYQSKNITRHLEVAKQLVDLGMAYYCNEQISTDQVENSSKDATYKNKEHSAFRGKLRDTLKDTSITKDVSGNIINVKNNSTNHQYVIRFRVPEGITKFSDSICGSIEVKNSEIDDFVLIRSDGMSTYMLAVVVDDHDMGISHIIRGDDHLTNNVKQKLIYDALGWNMPITAHLPLIRDENGDKLSKRRGALGICQYRKLGYLSEAINNYMLRLGWSHKDKEIIDMQEAISLFSIPGLGKSPARFDLQKLNYLNKYYLKKRNAEELFEILLNNYPNNDIFSSIDDRSRKNILLAIEVLKHKITVVNDLMKFCKLYTNGCQIEMNDNAVKIIENIPADIIIECINELKDIDNFTKNDIKETLKRIAEKHSITLNELMMVIKALLTGSEEAHQTFDMMEILGKNEVLNRLQAFHKSQ